MYSCISDWFYNEIWPKKPIFGLGKYGISQISKPDFGIEHDYGITEFGFGFAFPTHNGVRERGKHSNKNFFHNLNKVLVQMLFCISNSNCGVSK